MNKRLLLILGSFLFLAAGASAQSWARWIEQADSAFARRDFYPAFKYYEIALKSDTTSADLWYKYAESALQFNAFPYALNAYNRVLNSPQRAAFPLAALRMAEAYHAIGEYDRAQVFFQRFIDEQPGANPADLAKADKGIRDVIFAKQVMENPENLDVHNLGDKINTPYSDFGAVLHNDTLYYTSFSFVYRKDTHNPPRPFNKILASVDEGQGQPLPEYFNEPGKHVAHTAFNKDFSRIYYTICEYIGPVDVRCDLYFRNRIPIGWGPAQKLSINAAGYTNTQPAVGFDTETGEETLYFVSNRPGGRGKLDLWFTTLQPDGNCSTAVNLTALNTPEDDVTPFFHAPTQTLYFSSDGHPGLGGYDIFRSFKRGGGWDAPENLGLSYNSSFHDVYFFLTDDGSKALFSSNRPGAALLDKKTEVCCYDIWEIEIAQQFKINVLTFFKPDGSPLSGVTVQVFEIAPDGKQHLVNTLTNPSANDFKFLVPPGKRYLIEGTRPDHMPDSKIIDLTDPTYANADSAEVKLYLDKPAEELITLDVVTLRVDRSPLAEATVTLLEVTPDGREIPVASQTNKDANDFQFQVKRGRNYVLRGTRDLHLPAMETLDLTKPENIPPGNAISKELIFRQTTVPGDFQLDILAFSKPDGSPLPGVSVEIYEVAPDGSQTLVSTMANPSGNDFKFEATRGKRYLVKGTHPEYLPDSKTIDLNDPAFANTNSAEVKLFLEKPATPPLLLDVFTLREDRRELKGATVTLLEVSPEGRERRAAMDTKTTSNNFQFQVNPGINYVIRGTRELYFPAMETLDLSKPENLPAPGKNIRRELIFRQNTAVVDVLTFDSLTRNPLDSVRVTVFRINLDGSREEVAALLKATDNDYQFVLEPGHLYEVQGARPGYGTVVEPIDLRNNTGPVEVRLYLPPIKELVVKTFSRPDNKPLPAVQVELFEVKSDGTRSFITSNTNPEGNETRFAVEKDKKYFLNATHPGYFPGTETLDMTDPALKDKRLIERNIYLTPAQVNLEVVTLRRADRAPVNGSTLQLYEVGPDGKETLISTQTNKQGNDFNFPLETGKLYLVKGDNPNYYPTQERIDLRDPATAASGTIKRELLFDQVLPVKTFDAQTRNPLAGVRIELRPLDDPLPRSTTKENPGGNEFTFPVLPGRRYQLIAERPGYQRAVDTLTIPDDPNRRLDPIEVYLRQKGLPEFLPLALYFDNDRPDPRSTNSTTTSDYGQTFNQYYARKQEFTDTFIKGDTVTREMLTLLFKKESDIGKPLTEDEIDFLSEIYDNFFEREVKGGYRDLQAFSAKLLEFLREGNSISIELRGYASPRGATNYNLILSRRRAYCVRNYFYRYEGGALMEFIRNGKFKIGNIGFGEQTPDPLKASDRFDDLKGSIFSTQASIARRVEIVDVKIGENNN